MPSAFATIVCFTFFVTAGFAQYGTAPNNYYPDKYNGSTFTGTVTEAKDDQITLKYTKGSKVDIFTGRFETSCSVPSASGRHMVPSDIPPGTVMTAFFNRDTRKVDGQKVKENLILAISFEVWQGQKIAQDKRVIHSCSTNSHLQFRAWND
jgi:hypothetical protein